MAQRCRCSSRRSRGQKGSKEGIQWWPSKTARTRCQHVVASKEKPASTRELWWTRHMGSNKMHLWWRSDLIV